jgi:tetratricopeptide (TPR) repeat protein
MQANRRRLILFVCGLALLVGLRAEEPSDLRSPEFMIQVKQGFADLFELEYSAAQQKFTELATRFPEHPGPPLYQATTVWLRELFVRQDLDLDKFISPAYFTRKTTQKMSDADRTFFMDRLDRSRSLCQSILKAHPGNVEALYFLGAIEGVLGSFYITIDHSVKNAFKHGKLAYKYDSEVLKEDPKFYDAYMTVGTYEYIVGSLPWYIKWIAVIAGYHGSKQQGFEDLQLASENGSFVADDSRVLQMVLFVRERRYEDALRLADYLHERFPKNFLFNLNRAQIEEKLGRRGRALDIYLRIARLAEQGVPNYQKLRKISYFLQLAPKLRGARDFTNSEGLLSKVLADTAATPADRARAYLELGKTYDLDHRRAEAQAQYRKVLELPDVDGSRKEAKRLLERPFTG